MKAEAVEKPFEDTVIIGGHLNIWWFRKPMGTKPSAAFALRPESCPATGSLW